MVGDGAPRFEKDKPFLIRENQSQPNGKKDFGEE